jgi:hypothetical protein
MARITISAYAWVQADEPKRAFSDAQRQLLRGDAPQPRREQTLEVVKFVARRIRENPGETWEDRWKAWNRTCREDWTYQSYNGFAQVYRRFVSDYVYRKYEHPNDKKRARTPYEAYREDWNDRFTGRKDRDTG